MNISGKADVFNPGKRNDREFAIKHDGRKFYKFYLVNPKASTDPETVAEKLIGFEDVEEVDVTDGDYGFIVKTRFKDGREPADAYSCMHSRIDSKYGMIASCDKYKR